MAMKFVADLMRKLARWQFHLRDRSTLYPIGNEDFASIIVQLERMGWATYARYGGMDAGIDYDCIRLKRQGIKLKCEWDPWDQWSIEGPKMAIHEIAEQLHLAAKEEWRWDTWGTIPTGKSAAITREGPKHHP
ncbi:hypothetical protein [Ideonella sp. B508-1]|uniref:hypothetical protein n=1 Tax=Ideonella sp. B508-1 TaxID=137716 RepID=UPI0011D28755|nr:hypothetical protein [Ideonella sp. B508-1]